MADTVIVQDTERRGLGTALVVGAVGALGWLWYRSRGDEAPQRGGRDDKPEPRLVATAPNPDATTPSVPRYVGPSEPISRAFDRVFSREGQGIPIAYLRALAAHESDLHADLAKGPAWGLLQVVEVVRRDYNDRHQTSYERRDLLDPTINVRIAADLLAYIAESYRTHHTAPNLIEDWQNPRFVELLTYGWNAGYSERAGVGRVARYLENTNTPVTVATVQAAARTVGASAHLWEPIKVLYARAVTATYLRERERDRREGYTISYGTEIQVAQAPTTTVLGPAPPNRVGAPSAPVDPNHQAAPTTSPSGAPASHPADAAASAHEASHNTAANAASAHEAHHDGAHPPDETAAPAAQPH